MFAGIIAANALTYVYYALVGRVLGVAGYGVVSALFSATLLIATAPATVAATVVTRIAAGLYAAKDHQKLRRLGDLVSAASAGLGIAAFLAVTVAEPAIASYLHLASIAPVLAAGAVLALAFALPLQRSVLQGTQHFSIYATSMIVETALKAATGPLLALRFGVTGALAGLAIGSAVSAIYNALILRRLYSGRPARLRFDLRRMFVSSAGTGSAVLAINALLFYDVIIVRHAFDPISAGLYGATALVGRALYTVVSFIPTIVLPKAAARAAAGAAGPRSLLAPALTAAAAIIAGALVVTAAAPGTLVAIIAGRAFATAGPYVLPYVLALSFLALANIVAMYQIGLARLSFVVPLCTAAASEIATITIWHPTIPAVITVLVCGHCAAFLTTLFRIPLFTAPSSAESGAPLPSAQKKPLCGDTVQNQNRPAPVA
ncbi:MAG: polysaccharide biosynthesis C-terminal domain-containing protein [Candidatus Baltobacteraceae bacterium]